MPKVWEGRTNGAGLTFGIVVARFNSAVTDKLLDGALAALERSKVDSDAIEILRVPGAFEMPLAAAKLAASGRASAVVCLGAIVQGGTPHWDYLSDSVTRALCRLSVEAGVPVTNALLTTATMEQAVERASLEDLRSNKGYDAALAAVEMAELYGRLGES